MSEALANWLYELINNEYAVIFLVSLIPMIEVKGAILVGANYVTLSNGTVNIWAVFGLSAVSSLLVCPIILLVLKPIINWLKRFKWFNKLGESLERLFKDKATASDIKAEEAKGDLKKRLKYNIFLFLFVALPAPVTGVWTGSGIAAFSKQKYRYSVIPIVFGCIVQGLLFTVCVILGGQTAVEILSYAVLGLFLISLAVFLTRLFFKRRKITVQNDTDLSEKE